MRLGIGLNITRQNEAFRLSNLFAGDTAGIYHNFSDLTSLYTDSAGSTPLTLPDTTIGLVADRSRVRSPVTVAAGIQANAGLRPKWGRAPKVRRNLLTYSEQFDNAVWGKVNANVSADAAAPPSQSATADKIIATATSGQHTVESAIIMVAATVYTATVTAKADGIRYLTINSQGSANQGACFDLQTGALAIAAGPAVSATSLTSLGDGWYRLAMTFTNSFGRLSFAAHNTPSNGFLSYTGDGTSGILIWGAQLELGSTATAYQKTTSAFDMTEAGLPSYGFTRPDRSDDVLATTIPADQTGDVAIFGRNGSWIENAKTYAAASTFSLGATTATGLASGVLAAVGDIVGVLAIGKALSDAEKQLALDYHAARGAAGWLTAGAEMLTNGDFASDTVWTKGTGWTIAAGVATKVAGVASVLAQAVAPTALVAYQLDFTVTRTAGTVTPRFTGGTTVSGAAISASGTYRQLLVAASGNTAVDFSADTTFAGTIDNVSLKPLTVAA